MFSKGASIVGPITTIGPVWLVYYLATSEVPKSIEITVQETKEESKERGKNDESEQEQEEKKVEEQEKTKESESEQQQKSETITKAVLETTSLILSFLANTTKS